ncbi:hypothetical protein VTN77DRAFT_6716 [Rasamsonia byssochlamydoides]|uniref:mitochondrial 54S ribosomal protein uL10m n=1 Tax=Rasamsonia byssochlamydoides TaxID=89139 RepID=UPI0037448CC6
MPPRLRFPSSHISRSLRRQRLRGPQYEISSRCASTAAAAAATPAPSVEQMTTSTAPASRYPPSQPPSHRRPEERRSQLLRQYTSLIRTSPLMVLFQHNNLQSVEWTAIRRELNVALQKVDEQHAAEGRSLPPLAPHVKLQIIQTHIFEVALRIVEYFRPDSEEFAAKRRTADEEVLDTRDDPTLTHDLSRAVHDAVMYKKGKHELSTLLGGPLAVLSFPYVSPEHLKAALSVLAPKATGFPAPTRKANPGWHEQTVQDGLQKLMLLAARVDGKVFDVEETKWVGSIEGGMDGLRVQLVAALQSMGASITNALEGAGKGLYLTLESRRSVLEEEQKGGKEESQS